MKVEQLLKFSSAVTVEVIIKDEEYTRVATVDYTMNYDAIHIDAEKKFYGTSVILPDYIKKLTVEFFTDSRVDNYKGDMCNGIRIYCKRPKS